MEIKLTRNKVALVSPEDYEMVNRHKWLATSHGYAARNGGQTTRSGGRGIIYLHRVINRTPDGMFTDHIDGNRLNCTRENLRTVTPEQNSRNQHKQNRETSSAFKGVSLCKKRGKSDSVFWEASIGHEGVKVSLGNYVSEMDAALAYNQKAVELFGEHAKLNVLPLDFLRDNPTPRRFCRRNYSKNRGVTWNSGMKKWLAYAVKNQVRILESWHDTEAEAVQARANFDASRKELANA